jgi:hypothetical protein
LPKTSYADRGAGTCNPDAARSLRLVSSVCI